MQRSNAEIRPNPPVLAPPGNPVPNTASLPPTVAKPNDALVSSFPTLLYNLMLHEAGAPPAVAITLVAVPNAANEFEIQLHVPEALAQNQQACQSLHGAIVRYVQHFCAIKSQTFSGQPTAKTGIANIRINSDPTKRQALDRALAQLNSAATMIAMLGGSLDQLCQVLDDCIAAGGVPRVVNHFFSMFGGYEPNYKLYRDNGNITVVALSQHSPGRCIPLLHKLGFKDLALNLFKAAIEAQPQGNSKVKIVGEGYDESYVRTLVEEGALSDEPIAEALVAILKSVANAGLSTWARTDLRYCLRAAIDCLCSQAQPYPELAWQLLESLYPAGFEEEHLEGEHPDRGHLSLCAVLKHLFDSAMATGCHVGIAENAINALQDLVTRLGDGLGDPAALAANEAKTLLDLCGEVVSDYNLVSTLCDGEARQKLAAAGFFFQFSPNADRPFVLVIRPVADPSKQAQYNSNSSSSASAPATEFIPSVHGQHMVSYAWSLAHAPANDKSFAVTFLLPVMEFLCSRIEELSAQAREQMLDLVHFLFVPVNLPGKAVASATTTQGVAVARVAVQRFLEVSLLELHLLYGALAEVRACAANGQQDKAIRLVCWLSQNKSALFAGLPVGKFEAIFTASCSEFVKGIVLDEHPVDDQEARESLHEVMAPAVQMFKTVFNSNLPALSLAVAQPLFACWKKLAGPTHPACHTALLKYSTSKTVLPETDAHTLFKLADEAYAALKDHPQADPHAALALYEALIDFSWDVAEASLAAAASAAAVDPRDEKAVQAVEQKAAKGIGLSSATRVTEFLERLTADKDLLGQLAKTNPNAAVWAQLALARLFAKQGHWSPAHMVQTLGKCLAAVKAWDHRFDITFAEIIDRYLESKDEFRDSKPYALEAYALCKAFQNAHPGQPALQISVPALVQLSLLARREVATESGKHAPLDLLLSLLMDLAHTDAGVAIAELGHVVSSANIPIRHPTFGPPACLQLAKYFCQTGDSRRMAQAFGQALAAIPRGISDHDYTQLLPLFQEFFDLVESSTGAATADEMQEALQWRWWSA